MKLQYTVAADNFTRAGEASGAVKAKLKQLGFPSDVIRRVAIAMYEGEINMVIHANGGEATVDIEPEKIYVELADNGPGIPDSEKDNVFTMFYSGSKKVTDSKRSLGLGLALCRSIIRAHGCEIALSDNDPHGCCFSFTLPMKEVAVHE
jgi:K+-sensing histidine kinase KdpD